MSGYRDLPVWVRWLVAMAAVVSAVATVVGLRLTGPAPVGEKVNADPPPIDSGGNGADESEHSHEIKISHEVHASSSLNTTFTLLAGNTVSLPDLGCAVSWTYHEVAGVPIATLSVSPSSGPQITTAAVGPV